MAHEDEHTRNILSVLVQDVDGIITRVTCLLYTSDAADE